MAKWKLELDNLSYGGFAPQYWRETYPRSGPPNAASRMYAMDLTKPGYIQPGPGTVVMPGASAVTTQISNFTDSAVNSTIGYAIGKNAIYQINGVTASVSKIHTISGASTSSFGRHFDITHYGANLYYTHLSGVGQYDLSSTFNDTWWTNTLSATPLVTGVPHPMKVGSNDVLYIANGRYLASYDGTTAQDKALDFPTNYVVQDINWNNDRVYASVTYSALDESAGAPYSSVYLWDGTATSWETEIPVAGYVGANYVWNGNFFQFYFDRIGEQRLAVLSGSRFVDLASWDAPEVPRSGQVTDYKNFLLWVPGTNADDIFAYGPMDGREPPRLFHFADTGSGSAGDGGGITNMHPDPGIIFSNNDSVYYLDTDAGTKFQTTGVLWKSLLFDIAENDVRGGKINGIRFNFEKLTSGAVLDWSIVDSQGRTIYSDKISYAKATAGTPQHSLTTAFYPLAGLVAENFRVELNYANGSSTAPVRIMNIKLYGEG